MPINQETFNKSLFDLLKTQGYQPLSIDSRGDKMPVPNKADVFKIDVDGEDAWVTIDDAQNLKVYYDDEVLREDDSPEEFTDFLQHLKKWAKRRQLGFDLVNRDHLSSDMAQREYMKKEQMNEGYYPMGKKASYSDNIPQVKIILQHTRQIEEGEQRFRNVEKIFVENTNGERFAIPTNRPGLARVYARHIAEGGTPYDERGLHITSLVEEYSKMAGFVRATKNGQFNESAQRLVNEGINHYNNLRETLTRMTSLRGYNKYFESYTPVLNEETGDISLNELFVRETLDPRIESVMPILARLSKNINEMSEVKELEEWVESVTENLETLDEAKLYFVVQKGTKKVVGVWDGMKFKPFDRTKFKAGILDMVPDGFEVDKISGPVDSKQLGMATLGEEEQLDELGKFGKAAAVAGLAAAGIGGQNAMKQPNISQLQSQPDFLPTLTSNLANDPQYKAAMQTYVDALEHPDTPQKRLMWAKKYEKDQYLRVWQQTVDQARAKQPTLWNRIKNWVKKTASIEEMDSTTDSLAVPADKMLDEAPGAETLAHNQNTEKKNLKAFGLAEGFSSSEEVADQIVDSLGGESNLTSDDVYRAVEEYQSMMDSPHKLDTDEVVQIVMDRMNISDEVAEDLDANQKRVGQLGPTEKVKNNNIGKLVGGANESVDPLLSIKKLSGI